MFIKMLNLQIELLLLMLIGFIVKKKGIINTEQQKGLSELLVNVILPASILKSFISNDISLKEVLTNGLIAITICLVIQVTLNICLPFILKRFGKEKANIMEYGLLVSNSSFVGLPIIDALFGAEAVMYASIYLIPMRITMWTTGLALFTGKIELNWQSIKKIIFHPCIVSVILGIILMGVNIPVPTAISETVSMVSRSANCLSMFTIGAILANVNFHKIIDFEVSIFTLARLVILPLTVWVVLKLLNVDNMMINIAVLLTAMPCGSTCPILAQKYDMDFEFAAKLIFVTSVLSTITIPLICLLLK